MIVKFKKNNNYYKHFLHQKYKLTFEVRESEQKLGNSWGVPRFSSAVPKHFRILLVPKYKSG